MNKKHFIVLSITLIICLAYVSKAKYALTINQGDESKTIKHNSMVNINRSPFAFNFTFPKAASYTVDICALPAADYYNKFLNGVELPSLPPFQMGKAIAVEVNKYIALDSSIFIDNDAHQLKIHESKDYTSFHNFSEMEKSMTLTYHVDQFRYRESGEWVEYSLEEFPSDTLYMLMEFSIKEGQKKNKSLGILPFKIALN